MKQKTNEMDEKTNQLTQDFNAKVNRMEAEMNQKTNEMDEKTNEMDKKTNEMDEKTNEMYEKTNEMDEKTNEMRNKITKLTSDLNDARHIEEGTKDCVSLGSPMGAIGATTHIPKKHVTFDKSYKSAPHVIVVLREFDELSSKSSLDIYAKFITTTGFKVECQIGGRYAYLTYKWYSFPK